MSIVGCLSRFHKWIRDDRGVTAVETALVMPVICGAVLVSIDIGQAVYAKQQLNAAQRAGSAYLLSGDFTARETKKVIQDTFSGTGRPSVALDAWCACFLDNGSLEDETVSGDEGQTSTIGYEKTSTTLSASGMCPSSCSDGTRERVLVDIKLTYTTTGLLRSVTVSDVMSVRIR